MPRAYLAHPDNHQKNINALVAITRVENQKETFLTQSLYASPVPRCGAVGKTPDNYLGTNGLRSAGKVSKARS